MKPSYLLQSKRLVLQTKLKENFLKSDRKIIIWLCKAQSNRNLKSSLRHKTIVKVTKTVDLQTR